MLPVKTNLTLLSTYLHFSVEENLKENVSKYTLESKCAQTVVAWPGEIYLFKLRLSLRKLAVSCVIVCHVSYTFVCKIPANLEL